MRQVSLEYGKFYSSDFITSWCIEMMIKNNSLSIIFRLYLVNTIKTKCDFDIQI